MSTRVLLINEKYLRDNFDVSESLNSKSVIAAIYESQIFHLASVIGDKFYNELVREVEENDFTEVNKAFLDTYVQPFLGAQSMAVLSSKISYKVGNEGVTKSDRATDGKQIVDYYNNLTGIALRRMTDHLGRHYGLYSTWLNGFEGIKPHIDSSVDTGIFLGGGFKCGKYPIDKGWRR